MRLGYVRVFVNDFSKALGFYTRTLGLEASFADEDLGWAQFKTGEASLAIERSVPDGDEDEIPVGRWVGATLMVDDLTRTYEDLCAKDVEFARPPERMAWGGFMAHFKDPDGNVLTLLENR